MVASAKPILHFSFSSCVTFQIGGRRKDLSTRQRSRTQHNRSSTPFCVPCSHGSAIFNPAPSLSRCASGKSALSLVDSNGHARKFCTCIQLVARVAIKVAFSLPFIRLVHDKLLRIEASSPRILLKEPEMCRSNNLVEQVLSTSALPRGTDAEACLAKKKFVLGVD